jgi:aspartate/methionine/tyrosine aminotransferase
MHATKKVLKGVKMKLISTLSSEELKTEQRILKTQYQEFQAKKLSLDMSRGKPAVSQLDVSTPMLHLNFDYITEAGFDARNYGILDGVPECKTLFADLLGLEPSNIIIGGNSSLNLMYDAISRLFNFGTGGHAPWNTYASKGNKIKFLCPSPGYDRHFAICEAFGIEMITIPLLKDGPDMNMVKELVRSDQLIKGIWCVPLHSNPQGVCYSDEVVNELATLETAAEDFCIFWDNAYAIHHIYEEVKLADIFAAAKTQNKENRIYYFFSTSKITFPGAGIAMIASGKATIQEIKQHLAIQTIGSDKLNQLRHVQYFKTADRIKAHMKVLADILRPKFDIVRNTLQTELGGLGLASWSRPKGGYFISVDTLPGCAKKTVKLAMQAGVKLTKAGATYPYGNDQNDTNIRIAPSYPTTEELQQAMDLFCICVKLAGVNSLVEPK